MTRFLPQARATNLLMFAGCCGLMAVGYYFQYVLLLEPCPLCMTQRLLIILTGLIALAAFVHNPAAGGRRAYAVATLLSSIAGGSVSSRQVYLQSLPEDLVPACGPGLAHMVDTLPLGDVVKAMLTGDGNCAVVDWAFLDISIAGWTLVAFAGLALFSTWQLFRD